MCAVSFHVAQWLSRVTVCKAEVSSFFFCKLFPFLSSSPLEGILPSLGFSLSWYPMLVCVVCMCVWYVMCCVYVCVMCVSWYPRLPCEWSPSRFRFPARVRACEFLWHAPVKFVDTHTHTHAHVQRHTRNEGLFTHVYACANSRYLVVGTSYLQSCHSTVGSW